MAHDYKKILAIYENKAREIPSIKKEFEELYNWYHQNGKNDELNYEYRQRLGELIKNSSPELKDELNAEDVKDNLAILLEKIREREKEIMTKSDKQYKQAIWQVPIVIGSYLFIFLLTSVFGECDFYNEFLFIFILVIVSSIVHSYFLLRFYQQSISLKKELMEKELGTEFLKHAISDPKNKDIYKFGIQMFLQHHRFQAPFNHDDISWLTKLLGKNND